VRVVQQRRDTSWPGVPAYLRGPGDLEGRMGAQQTRPPPAQGGWALQEARHHLLQPEDAVDPGLLRALDLRLLDTDRRAGPEAHPGGTAEVAAHRQEHEGQVVLQLGRQPRWLRR